MECLEFVDINSGTFLTFGLGLPFRVAVARVCRCAVGCAVAEWPLYVPHAPIEKVIVH